jgi:hypothetical protein
MNLQSFWESLETSSVGTFVAESTWAFPTIESAHVIALVTVVGTIAVMDLRLLGLASTSYPVRAISRDTLRWTWVAFVLAAITGGLLFASNASGYAGNPHFQRKIILLVLAGLNMAVFHLFTWRSIENWDSEVSVPLGAKIAGTFSLLLWVGVVFFGRMVGFTLGAFG